MNEFRLPMEYNWELAHKKIAKTEYYELDLATTNAVQVSTIKGIIEILNINTLGGGPGYTFSSPIQFYVNNPKLLLTEANRDNIYIQYSIYYKPGGPDPDPTVPYVVSSGVIPDGIGFTVYNAAGSSSITDLPWQGKFYFYYEIYTK